MDKQTIVRTGIAAAVAGVGLAVGGVALASAEDSTAPQLSQRDGSFGHRFGGGIASELAEKLGLDEDKVADALRAVSDELRPERPELEEGERPTPPTDDEIAERQAALAKALAEELGVSEAKVTAALKELRADAEAELDDLRADERTRLVERLDAAVEAGTLTEADKASVLKAYDAKIIGGIGRGGFGHHFGGPGFRGGPGGADGAPEGGPST